MMRIAATFLCALMIAPSLSNGSDAKSIQAPDDLKEWGLHCFCLGARQTPHAIVRLDDNGRILYHARDGITVDQLNTQGIATTQSQMVLLQSFGLLRRNGDVYKTSLPILGPGELSILRPKLKQMALAIAPKVAPQVQTIKEVLDHQGLSDSHYAIVFGYALDGLLWDQLRKNGLHIDTRPDLDHPYWKGLFWAIYPERAGEPGTNQVSQGTTALTLTWTDRVAAPLHALETAPSLPAFLKSIERGDTPEALPVTSNAMAWPLTRGGKLAIPLIRPRADDQLYGQSLAIANIVAETLQKDPQGQSVLTSVRGATQSEATLIVAHELIWDVMDVLVAKGYVHQPPVLNGAPSTPENLRPLLFLTLGAH